MMMGIVRRDVMSKNGRWATHDARYRRTHRHRTDWVVEMMMDTVNVTIRRRRSNSSHQILKAKSWIRHRLHSFHSFHTLHSENKLISPKSKLDGARESGSLQDTVLAVLVNFRLKRFPSAFIYLLENTFPIWRVLAATKCIRIRKINK